MPDLSSLTQDAAGTQHLLDDSILDVRFVDLSTTRFQTPDEDYTGYAASGFWYTDGLPDPLHVPFKASWASEGEYPPDPTVRGTLDSFPTRIFVLTTPAEVVILDADTLIVWMRFTPLTGAKASTYGSLLGDETTALYSADFVEGFLLVATSQGLRVADFRADAGTVLDGTTQYRSFDGLDQRQVDGFLDGLEVVFAGNRLVEDVCLHVRGERNSNLVLAAVGHHRGLSGLIVSGSGDFPRAKVHEFSVEYAGTAWEAFDDNDGDATTPVFRLPSSETPWTTDGVRAGDLVLLDDVLFAIESVEGDYLMLSPELDVGASGTGFMVYRPVSRTFVSKTAVLYAANGGQRLMRVSTDTWYYGVGPIDGFGSTALVLSGASTEVSGLAVSGGSVWTATDDGVFYTADADFLTLQSAERRYSSGVTGSATYEILGGNSDSCTCVDIDPETGHLLVGVGSLLVEIDMSIHQAFRSIEDLGDPVQAVVAYRNPYGPPDVEN